MKPRSFAAAAAAISLAACTGQRLSHPNSPFSQTGIEAYLKKQFSERRVAERIDAYRDEQDPEVRRRMRDEFVHGVMFLIDLEYEFATDRMHGVQTWVGAAADVTSIALDAAATLSTGFAARLLAGLSGVTTASWAAFDRNVFADRSVSAIVTKMDALRAEQRARIDRQLQLGDAQYPLWRALSDVADYFLFGSPVKAIDAIANDAAMELRQARTTVLR